VRYWTAVLFAASAWGQAFTQRGFLEARTSLYPQTGAQDRARVVGEGLLRYEAAWTTAPGLRLSGAVDARADTHRQVERSGGVSWFDRDRRRPALAVRRFSAAYRAGPLTIEAGKQLIRWGKADILNPTDRFAPRDYLAVVDNEFLGVTAVRLTYERGSDTVDLVWSPRFTPSRLPLLDQRWVVIPRGLPEELRLVEAGARLPGGPQFGVRWNRLGGGFEYSLSFYQGFHHLPLMEARPLSLVPPRIEIERLYPGMRMFGGDAAIPLRWLTVKAEAGYFTSTTPRADEYALYVVQLERHVGEWIFVAGYAGQAVTRRRSVLDFAPDRGLTRAFLGRAGYTIDANRSLAIEGAARENGRGVWARLEYTQAFGRHWRATAALVWIHGSPEDFLGQYRRNSHGEVVLRYSF